MSTFNISDITLAGAYVNAVTAATDSDHRTAGRRLETGEGSNVVKLLKALVRRIASAIVEMRPTVSQPTSHPI